MIAAIARCCSGRGLLACADRNASQYSKFVSKFELEAANGSSKLVDLFCMMVRIERGVVRELDNGLEKVDHAVLLHYLSFGFVATAVAVAFRACSIDASTEADAVFSAARAANCSDVNVTAALARSGPGRV
jgi:hypothetical protein